MSSLADDGGNGGAPGFLPVLGGNLLPAALVVRLDTADAGRLLLAELRTDCFDVALSTRGALLSSSSNASNLASSSSSSLPKVCSCCASSVNWLFVFDFEVSQRLVDILDRILNFVICLLVFVDFVAKRVCLGYLRYIELVGHKAFVWLCTNRRYL